MNINPEMEGRPHLCYRYSNPKKQAFDLVLRGRALEEFRPGLGVHTFNPRNEMQADL